ncbi:MAG: hypothetical protein ACP6IT_11245, partial [Candidatus Thorarchaeota archaeon]
TDDCEATITSTADGYHVENLQDRDKYTLWIAGNNNDPQQLDMDFGEAKAVRALLIVHSSLYTQNAGIKLIVDGNDQAGFPNPQYLIGSATQAHLPTSDDEPLWFERLGQTVTKRYWRLEFWHSAPTLLRVSDVYLMPEINIGSHPGGPWGLDFHDTTTLEVGDVIYGVAHSEPVRRFRLEFNHLTKSQVDEILEGYSRVKAGFLPFLYVDEFGVRRLVRLEDRPRARHHLGPYWTMTLNMIEER